MASSRNLNTGCLRHESAKTRPERTLVPGIGAGFRRVDEEGSEDGGAMAAEVFRLRVDCVGAGR